jgi:hypothetical protein
VGEPRLADGTILRVDGDPPVVWTHRSEWLAPFAGRTVAMKVAVDAAVTIRALGASPHPDPALVRRVRAAAEHEEAEAQLPVTFDELVLAVLLDDPHAFDEPQAPLSELVAAAGLEVRHGEIASSEEIWANLQQADRMLRMIDSGAGEDEAVIALEVLRQLEDPATPQEALRQLLRELPELDRSTQLLDELLAPDGAWGDAAVARQAAARLVDAARRPVDRAVACWVAGLMAERSGDVTEADRWFAEGVRSSDELFPLVDRAAWYASVRGDAPTAARLWSVLDEDRFGEQALVQRFATASGPSVGRNDPCWCGSGRKFKACHLGQVTAPPLQDRLAWLRSKAFGWATRHRPQFELLMDLAVGANADGEVADVDGALAALRRPLPVDVALHEGGAMRSFADTFAALLPADERPVVRDWARAMRTVVEVRRAGKDTVTVVDIDLAADPDEEFDVRSPTRPHRLDPRSRWAVVVLDVPGDTPVVLGPWVRVHGDEETGEVVAALEHDGPEDVFALLDGLDRRD